MLENIQFDVRLDKDQIVQFIFKDIHSAIHFRDAMNSFNSFKGFEVDSKEDDVHIVRIKREDYDRYLSDTYILGHTRSAKYGPEHPSGHYFAFNDEDPGVYSQIFKKYFKNLETYVVLESLEASYERLLLDFLEIVKKHHLPSRFQTSNQIKKIIDSPYKSFQSKLIELSKIINIESGAAPQDVWGIIKNIKRAKESKEFLEEALNFDLNGKIKAIKSGSQVNYPHHQQSQDPNFRQPLAITINSGSSAESGYQFGKFPQDNITLSQGFHPAYSDQDIQNSATKSLNSKAAIRGGHTTTTTTPQKVDKTSNNTYHPDFKEKFESKDVELLWTVNYSGIKDSIFPDRTCELIASRELATAVASFQTRRGYEAPGQVTYLALTAVRKSDLDSAFCDEASKKFQPDSDKKIQSYMKQGFAYPIRHLTVIMPTENGGFKIIQQVDQDIQSSRKYQAKLHQLYEDKTLNLVPGNNPVVSQTKDAVKLVIPNIDASTTAIAPLQNAGDGLSITVTTNTGGTLGIDCHSNDTVLQLKQRIAEKESIDIRNLQLTHDGKILEDQVPFSECRAFKNASCLQLIVSEPRPPAITTTNSTMTRYTTNRYLMFDVLGVLGGDIIGDGHKINEYHDLVLKKYDWGDSQVLVNGIKIIKYINELVKNYGYQVVLHSKDQAKDQFDQIKLLKKACSGKYIPFPKIVFTGVFDQFRFGNFSSSKPEIIFDDINIVGWGQDDLAGKVSLRRALEEALHIQPETRGNHVVFDGSVEVPPEEGYRSYLINSTKPLYDAVKEVFESAWELDAKLKQQAAESSKQHNFFQPGKVVSAPPEEYTVPKFNKS